MKLLQGRMLIIIIFSVVIFLYVIVMLFGLQVPSRSAGDVLQDDSGTGYYLFYTLLERLGYSVKKVRAVPGRGSSGGLIYLGWTGENESGLAPLYEWVSRGNPLLLIGITSDTDPLLNRELHNHQPAAVELRGQSSWEGAFLDFQASRSFSSPGEAAELARNEHGPVWLRTFCGDGELHMISAGDMLNNRNLREENLALFLNDVLGEYYNQPLYFMEETVIPASLANPILVLFRGRLFFVTIHLILLGGLFLYAQGKRFHSAQIFEPYARRSLSGHIKAVGELYMRAKAVHLAALLESKYFMARLRAAGNWARLSDREVVRLASVRYGFDETELLNLMEVPDHLNDASLLARVRNQQVILKKLGR